MNLNEPHTARQYYNQRFSRGYLEYWPKERKRRIVEVIQSLKLPPQGDLLDFGCGNGVLTDLLRQTLHGWRAFGSDISATAIENARRWYPNCSFFTDGDLALKDCKFDFVFTHHVLEHVADLPQTLDAINAYLKLDGTILHILPCGNPGSFEHTICLLRKDGVDHQPGQRFFYENEGHIRCLTTVQLQQLYAGHGFDLVRACYNNHHDGAINKITHNPFRFVWAFADPSMAVDDKGRRTLRQWRVRLLAIWFLRSPAMVVEGKLRQRYRTLLDVIKLLVCLPLYPLAKPVDRYWQHRAHREWQRHKDESNGSEMFLVFRR